MADEIRSREGATAVPPRAAPDPTTAEPARQLPAEAEAAGRAPDHDDPLRARADIEATRARMSHTLDELEGALVERKERLQDRLDLLAPVRENPWPAMGVALGAGVLLGLITGGDEDDEYDGPEGARRGGEYRGEVLERRTRRLRAIARRQEAEIRRLRSRSRPRRRGGAARLAHRIEGELDEVSHSARHYADVARGGFDDLRHTVANGLSLILTEALRQLIRRR